MIRALKEGIRYGVSLIGEVSAPEGFADPSGTTEVITGAIKVLLAISTIASLLYIVFSGVKYTTSAGDPGKIKSAQSTLLYAVIGLIVSFMAWVILGLVGTAFGVGTFDFSVLNGS